MIHDVRCAVRSLRKSPSFFVVAVLTLAIGIGANIAVFSVVDAVLFKPLVYPEPERIVRIQQAPLAITKAGMTTPRVMEESRAFDGVGTYVTGGLNLGDGSRSERVRAASVSAGFFRAMGTQPFIGRTFTREEMLARARVAVVGHSVWRRHLQSSATLDRPILLNGEHYAVVGVMPPRYVFPGQAEVWIPTGVDSQIAGSTWAPNTIARLAPGTTIAQAIAEVERIETARSGPRRPNERAVTMMSLDDELVGTARPLLVIVTMAVALVLLVACVNTTNLLLARVSAREREMAVRRALGASSGQLLRQLLCESAVLSATAALVALPLALWVVGAVKALLPLGLHGAAEVGLDLRAVAFTFVLALLTTIAFGALPAMWLGPRQASEALRGTAVTARPVWRRVQVALVVTELASAVVLLTGAITLVQTVRNVLAVDLGARGERATTFQLTLPVAAYPTGRHVSAFFERLYEQLRGMGIEAAGAASTMPGTAEMGRAIGLEVDGLSHPDAKEFSPSYVSASSDYFTAIGIDVIAGRTFTVSDDADAPSVAIVSDKIPLALGLTPTEILGRRLNVGRATAPEWAEIVGVVRNVRLRGPEATVSPQVYVPLTQRWSIGTMYVAAKSRIDAPVPTAAALAKAVQAVDPSLPPYNVRTFAEVRDSYVADRRFTMVMMLSFAAVAAVLAAIGLYGVMSYIVQLRTREIGIRAALGASASRVFRQTLAAGLAQAGAGIVIGAAVVSSASRFLASKVASLRQVDALDLLLTAGGMAVLATVTMWIPARRAARVDPIEALREG